MVGEKPLKWSINSVFITLGSGLIRTLGNVNPPTQSFQRFNYHPISHPQTHAFPYILHIPIQMFVFDDVVFGHEYTDIQFPPRNVIHQTRQNRVAKCSLYPSLGDGSI
jgi:hypothetical protein